MEKEKWESLIIDYIDNNLGAADRERVERELATNPEAVRLYEELKELMQVMARSARLEPGPGMQTRFDDILRQEIASAGKTKTVFFSPVFYRVAAAVTLLVLGGSIGFWISRHQAQQERLLAIENELKETKQMMMSMLDNELSPSQRILGVNVALKIDKTDDEIIRALVKAMNDDPNTNVRLAALDALSTFSNEPAIRKELVTSLSRQTDPVVQIALIQLMVRMKEKSVVKDLQQIVDDTETMKAVKDEAYSGILKLS